MDGQLRKIVAGHARSYRNYKAFLRGYGEGSAVAGQMGDEMLGERARIRSQWVEVIDTVRRKLETTDPEKAEVLVRLFDLDGFGKSRDNRVIRLAMDLNTSQANVYRWRENVLDQIILAATQRGLLHPFAPVQEQEKQAQEG